MESRQGELFVLESIDRRARIGLRLLFVLTHCAISLGLGGSPGVPLMEGARLLSQAVGLVMHFFEGLTIITTESRSPYNQAG